MIRFRRRAQGLVHVLVQTGSGDTSLDKPSRRRIGISTGLDVQHDERNEGD